MPFRNSRKTDWSVFRESVDRGLGNTLNLRNQTENINGAVETLTKVLKSSFELSCPVIYPGSRKQPKWWTKVLGDQRSIVRRLFNRAKLTRSEADWNAYRLSFNKYKADIKRAKRSSWMKFCDGVNSVSELSRFRRVLSKEPSTPGFIQRADNSWTESGSESLKLLMETHFPGCINAEDDHQFEYTSNPMISDSVEVSFIHDMITRDKVAWAVNTFQPYKSPGPDGIFPAMLQNVNEGVILWIVEIFRECIKHAYIPGGWREVKVVFIPKAGKATHSKPRDYRPISLSSFLLKTLERLVDLYIRTKLDTQTISGAQHAYIKGRSVDSALHDVVSVVEKGLHDKEYTLAAFLDIEGAFNNVTIEAIEEALRSVDIHARITDWIITMLKSRVINSVTCDVNIRKLVTRGTPQGGVLSPLLWLLVVNAILRRFDARGWKIVAYADDVVLLVTGKFLPTISDIMQSELRELSIWAISKGLNVNPEKTELVLFTRRYKVENFRLPILNGTELRLAKEAKYLGVYLDSKLSWRKNTQERVKKSLNAYYTCKNSISKNWGLKPKMVFWLYTTVVRPVLAYGCSVWWEALRTETGRKLLSKVQRCASIGMTSAMSSTPQAALDTILHLTPIEEFVRGMAAQSLFRLKEIGHIGNFTLGHARILNEVKLRGLSISRSPPSDYLTSTIDFEAISNIEIPNRELWIGKEQLHDGLAIFTDGSKMDIGTGAGVYFMGAEIRHSYRLFDECSVFQAEILGILKALELVEDNVDIGSELTIYVDSQAALLALAGHSVRSKLVKKCREKWTRLRNMYLIRLCWVPGHCDVVGNEVADELARSGSALDISLADISVNIPLGTYYRAVRTWTLNKANQSWKNRSTCRISRALWPSYNLRDTNVLLGLTRNKLRVMIGIITGHFKIGRMMSKWDSSISDVCRICEDEEETESIEHILCHCPGLQINRLRWLGDHFLNDLEEISVRGLSGLLGFVSGIKWLWGQPI